MVLFHDDDAFIDLHIRRGLYYSIERPAAASALQQLISEARACEFAILVLKHNDEGPGSLRRISALVFLRFVLNQH